MESRANVIAAGLFVIAMTIGLIAAALWLSRDSLDRVRYLVVARIPVSGLHVKAAVRLRGVDIGRVESIGFDPQDRRTILVGIAVDRSAALSRGAYGQLAFQGVTGLSYLSLDDDGSQPQALATSDAAPGRLELRPSLIDGLGDAGRDLLRDAAQVAHRLNAALGDDNLARVNGTLRNTESAARQLALLAQDLQPAARGLQALESDTRATMQHLDLVLGDLHAMSSRLAEPGGQIDRIGRGAQAVGEASQALQAAVVDRTLPRLDQTLDDLSRTSRGLERLLGQIEQRPQSLVFGPAAAPPGPGEPGFAAPAGAR